MRTQLQNITLIHDDCMNVLRSLPDNSFDLAIVDPPYGIGAAKMNMGGGKKHWSKKDWDNSIPQPEYFDELFRVSDNQIIFGGNYFTEHLPPSRCWLSWNKEVPAGMSFADLELAWTSFDKVAREIRCRYSGGVQSGGKEIKIHPTQKPVNLYKWLLSNYVTGEGGGKILDTHLGSGSIAIACHDYGFELTGIELNEDYYTNAVARVRTHQMNQSLFAPNEL